MAVLPLLLAAALVPVADRPLPLVQLPDAHVGKVRGSDAFVAFSLDRGRLRAYVCDGTLRSDPTIATWFHGHWDGRRGVTLVRGGHTLRIDGVDGEGRVVGSIDAYTFKAAQADMPAGLFHGRDRKSGIETTWIVLPDGRKRGTFVPLRPPKCRVVLVTGADGTTRWVTTCG
jgi:hypothetical protein